MNKKIIWFGIIICLFICFGVISSSSALELEAVQFNLGNGFPQGECIELRQSCTNCTFVNITLLLYPNSSTGLSNVPMTKIGTVYNRTFCETSALGTYTYWTLGDPDGDLDQPGITFEVTPNGEIPTTAKAFLYIGLVFFLFLLLGLIFWAHLQDQSPLARFWWFAFMWIPIWAILFIGWSMASDFLTSQGAIAGLFWWAWVIIGSLYPFFLLGLVLYTFYYIYKDKQVQNLIKRGVSVEDAQAKVFGRNKGGSY